MDASVAPKSRPNKYLSLLIWLMPHCSFKLWALRRLGNHIGNNVTIGITLVMGCGPFWLDDGAWIGIGNAFRNLAHVRMGRLAQIGRWNQITAAPEYQQFSDYVGMLLIGESAGMTNRHYLDCSGQIILRHGAGVGGIRSILQSHEIDLLNNKATVGQIVLGEFAMTATGCILLKDSYVPDHSILAAGSVLTRKPDSVEMPTGLYGGVPARHKRDISYLAWWDRGDVNHTPETPFDDAVFRAELLNKQHL